MLRPRGCVGANWVEPGSCDAGVGLAGCRATCGPMLYAGHAVSPTACLSKDSSSSSHPLQSGAHMHLTCAQLHNELDHNFNDTNCMLHRQGRSRRPRHGPNGQYQLSLTQKNKRNTTLATGVLHRLWLQVGLGPCLCLLLHAFASLSVPVDVTHTLATGWPKTSEAALPWRPTAMHGACRHPRTARKRRLPR